MKLPKFITDISASVMKNQIVTTGKEFYSAHKFDIHLAGMCVTSVASQAVVFKNATDICDLWENFKAEKEIVEENDLDKDELKALYKKYGVQFFKKIGPILVFNGMFAFEAYQVRKAHSEEVAMLTATVTAATNALGCYQAFDKAADKVLTPEEKEEVKKQAKKEQEEPIHVEGKLKPGQKWIRESISGQVKAASYEAVSHAFDNFNAGMREAWNQYCTIEDLFVNDILDFQTCMAYRALGFDWSVDHTQIPNIEPVYGPVYSMYTDIGEIEVRDLMINSYNAKLVIINQNVLTGRD